MERIKSHASMQHWSTVQGKGSWIRMAGKWLAVVVITLSPLSAGAVGPRQLVEVADISGPVISPDGRQVAFRVDQASIQRNTYDTVWYVQDLETRAPPRRVAEGGEQMHDVSGVAIAAVAQWSADGKAIFFRAAVDGRVDVWRAAADGSGAFAVTRDDADVRDFLLSDDGTVLRYAVGASRSDIVRAEQEEYERGIHVDATVPIGQGLYRSGFNSAGRLATQRFTGLGFGRDELLAGAPDRWKAIQLTAGEHGRAIDEEPPLERRVPVDRPEYGLTATEVVVDRDSGRKAVLSKVGAAASPRSELSVLPLKEGNAVVKCLASDCVGADINSMQWRPGRPELIFTTSSREQGWVQSIYRWNVESGEVVEVTRSEGLISGGRERASPCGISSETLVCVIAGALEPPHLEAVDIQSGVRRELLAPNQGLQHELDAAVTSRFLRWTDARGRVYTGHLFIPRIRGKSLLPMFVTYYHCAGFLRGGMGDEWPLASLAQSGIAALCINALPHQPEALNRYDEGISALRGAVSLLSQEGVIDRTKVGMGGLSFGSEVALWVATETDLLSAASVTSPSVTPLLYLMAGHQGGRYAAGLQASWGLGAPDATSQRWHRLSPAFNWKRISTPVLFQMPENEYLYALDYVLPMVREKKADLYVFPQEKHQKFQPKHKLAAYQRNLEWFEFWLLDAKPPSPGEEAQYQHWSEMRRRIQEAGMAASDGADR